MFVVGYTILIYISTLCDFTQGQNCLMTHFSECIFVITEHMTVDPVSQSPNTKPTLESVLISLFILTPK